MGHESDGELKPLNKVFERDEFVTHSISDRHAVLSQITLIEKVPLNVRNLFETAKNVSLYAWFDRHFHPVAEFVGFSALEAALASKYNDEFPESVEKSGTPVFKQLLDKAVEESWIKEEGIDNRMNIARGRLRERNSQIAMSRNMTESPEPTREELEIEERTMKLLPEILSAARMWRNTLAHGKPASYGRSETTLRITASLINQVFSN